VRWHLKEAAQAQAMLLEMVSGQVGRSASCSAKARGCCALSRIRAVVLIEELISSKRQEDAAKACCGDHRTAFV